tara:strand:- start:1288 stop:1563 length:276 start_codon:yes stop_codon:yes gene_type:complete
MSFLDHLPGIATLSHSLRPKPVDAIIEGATFQSCRRQGVRETAKVVSIGPDTMGIDHVTYDLEISKPVAVFLVGRRMLNLESFKSRFPIAL